MKILKYGEGYPKTATCGNCGSELQYEFHDLCHKSDRVRSSDPLIVYEDVDIYYIQCPVCGQDIAVDRKVKHAEFVGRGW